MNWKPKLIAALLAGVALVAPACDVGNDGSDVTNELEDVGREVGEAVEEMGEEAEQGVDNAVDDVSPPPSPAAP